MHMPVTNIHECLILFFYTTLYTRTGDRHTNVWFWIQKSAVAAVDGGEIKSDIRLMSLCNAITLMRDKANDLMSCIDRDQPPPYCDVVAALVNLNLLLISLSKGIEWAILFFESGGAVWLTPQMYAEVFLNIAFNTMFARVSQTEVDELVVHIVWGGVQFMHILAILCCLLGRPFSHEPFLMFISVLRISAHCIALLLERRYTTVI